MQFLEPYLRDGWNILLVVLGLGLIVFLHELGHFMLAKKNKVRVEAFSLGFGPVIWKRRHGETEYRLSVFPLGGYVKMAGESLVDDRRGEPWELTSKTPWQRFQIFVAGATMNLLIAFPIAIAAYAVGKVEPVNIVGQPGYAEALGGIRPGDQILRVGERKIDSLDKLLPEVIRRSNGSAVPVRVLRYEDGKPVEKTFDVVTRQSPYHRGGAVTTFIRGLQEKTALYEAGLRDKDQIVAVNGERVNDGFRAAEIVRDSAGKEVVVEAVRWKSDWATEALPPMKFVVPARETWRIPTDDHLVQAVVGKVRNGTAAWGKLEPKDKVVAIDGRPVRSWREMRGYVEASAVKEIEVAVEREGAGTVKVRLIPGMNGAGKGVLGIEGGESSVVAYVEPGSYFDQHGLKAGDVLRAYGKKDSEKELMVPRAGFGSGDKAVEGDTPPASVPVRVRRGNETVSIDLPHVRVTEGDLKAVGLEGKDKTYAFSEGLMQRDRAFSDALAAGLREPVDVTLLTFDLLRKLVTLEESAKGLSGPIGIFQATFQSVSLSFGNYLWLLCLITVNLGVFNLLPIPVLDGGHNVLLLIEVIRKWFGKSPPSEKFVATFQYAGLLFILCLFVMVTFNDIRRIWSG